MKTKPISDDTRNAILDVTWSLIAKKKRLDVSQAEIAAAAGVSRQTVYLAFGSRAGLLTAMLRHRDARTDHATRLRDSARLTPVTASNLLRYVEVWLDYLPIIYPVGILLDAASVTDDEAASAWDDRMKDALLGGLIWIAKQLAKGEQLRMAPKPAAEQVWSLVHPTAWRQLVVDSGWTAEEFRASRLGIIRATVLR